MEPKAVDPLAGNPTYAKVKDLGLGSFGSVALYTRNEGRGEPSLCAVKFMTRSGPGVDVNLIQREIQSHRVLRHPHVIRFKQLGLTPSHIFMCMEFADQGDLLGFLRRKGPLPEADARWLFQQIVFGLDYCHLKGVVNRDLKPENLLLKLTPEASKRHRRHQMQEREQQQKLRDQLAAMQLQQQQQQLANGGAPSPAPQQLPPLPPLGLVEHRTSNTFNLHIKIADFGLSKRAAHSLPKTRVGTINYMAPEVLLAGPSQRYDGAKADIWSAGVVLYAMLFSRVPFEVHQQDAAQQAQQAAYAAAAAAAAAAGQPPPAPYTPPGTPPPGAAAPPPPGARDRAATIQRILEGDWSVPPGMSVSPQALHLLTQMLVPDPARRISMDAIMEHPWFRAGLPAAALTMNTALVRQQAAQAPGAAGEQAESDIDSILEQLRNQAERETAAAVAACGSCSYSRGSEGDSEGRAAAADERRNYEFRGMEDQQSSSPGAAAQSSRFRPQQQQQPYGQVEGAGVGQAAGPGAGRVSPQLDHDNGRDCGCGPAAMGACGGGGGGVSAHVMGAAAAPLLLPAAAISAPVVPSRPGGRPSASGGAGGGGLVGCEPAGPEPVRAGHLAPPPPPHPYLATAAPNAFLAQLADLGPAYGGGVATGLQAVPAARSPATVAAAAAASAAAAMGTGGGGRIGGGGIGGGGHLVPASSESRRAEALEAIDCIRLAPGHF